MSKPLILRRSGGKFELYLDVAEARRRAMRASVGRRLDARGYPATGLIPLEKDGKKVDFVVGGKPAKLTKEQATGIAHQFGHYILELGDFVYTYLDEEGGTSRDRTRSSRGSEREQSLEAARREVRAIKARWAAEKANPALAEGRMREERARLARIVREDDDDVDSSRDRSSAGRDITLRRPKKSMRRRSVRDVEVPAEAARAHALIQRAAHEGTPEEEARTSAVIAAKEIVRKNLRIVGPQKPRAARKKPAAKKSAKKQSGLSRGRGSRRDAASITRREPRRFSKPVSASGKTSRGAAGFAQHAEVLQMTRMLHQAGYPQGAREAAAAYQRMGIGPAELEYRIRVGDVQRGRDRSRRGKKRGSR